MKRDKKLDCIKGLACILMIFAHGHGYGKTIDNWLTLLIYQLGLFAPVLFLSSVGVSLTYQIKKRHKIPIIAGYILLFIMSFANMGLRNKEYFILTDWNLYASISLSAILTLFIIDYVNLFTAFIPIILLFFLNKTNIPVSLFYGGLFSIIPWTSFTLIGLYLNSHKYFIKVFLALSFISTLLFLTSNKHGMIEYNKPIYFALGIFIYSFSLNISSMILKLKYISRVFRYLGQNSLLFYVIHRLIVIYLPFKLFAPVLWLFLFITTIMFMIMFTEINSRYIEKYSAAYFFWVLLIIAVLIPSLLSMNINLQRALMFGVLVLHALNYHNFINLGIFNKNYNNKK